MSKKFFYVAALLAGLVFTGTSCADDKGDNDDDDDDAIDLDSTASNANSWGNYMVNVASLLKKDAEDLYNYWYISYKGNESYATTFKNHNNATYSSASSCIQELIEGGMTIANEVGDAKIGDPYDLYMKPRKLFMPLSLGIAGIPGMIIPIIFGRSGMPIMVRWTVPSVKNHFLT